MNDKSMAPLFERSSAFHEAALTCFPEAGPLLAVENTKSQLVATACMLCLEHGDVLRAAFALNAPSSGSALLRLQYEALLRGVWLQFAATSAQAERLSRPLDPASEQAAKNLPSYLEMLSAVSKSAPRALAAPLEELNQYSRHALNSFVHSGIHALHRSQHGYPIEMAVTVVRFSNGLSHFAYRMLASLSNSQRRMDRITRLHVDFSDCLPPKPGGAPVGI